MNPENEEKIPDRRAHPRRECRGAVEWTLFNRSERFSGVILNYSEAGAYIESLRKMKPGSSILLHTGRVMIACEKSDDCLPPNATLLAEIKWGQSQGEVNDIRRYGAGIRYHF